MISFKNAIKSAARLAGYSIQGYRISDVAFEVRVRLLAGLGVDLVLDVGGYIGCYGRALRSGGYRGQIVSFEPVSSAFEKLRSEASRDDNWKTYCMALANRTERATMGVTNFTYSSSLLPISTALLDAAPELAPAREETVTVERLDTLGSEVLGGAQRIFLKLDVQGYERQVLEGATDCLDRVVAIDCELSLIELYVGQPLFREMIDYLDDLGFEPYHFDRTLSNESTGKTLQLDSLFVRCASAKDGLVE